MTRVTTLRRVSCYRSSGSRPDAKPRGTRDITVNSTRLSASPRVTGRGLIGRSSVATKGAAQGRISPRFGPLRPQDVGKGEQ